MKNNLFNTDTKALEARENQNKNAQYNLEDWMMNIIEPAKGIDVLDIGCGRGKQIFVIEKIISPGGSITGLDASQEAVDTVKEIAIQNNLSNIKVIKGLIDDIPDILSGQQFDLIMSTYAIYYSQNLKQLLINLKPHLKNNGQLFICGNGKGSNDEVVNLMKEAGSNPTRIDDFIAPIDIKEIGKHFKDYKTYTLNNKVTFISEADFLSWWRNHNMYDYAIDKLVSDKIKQIFNLHGKFEVSKNVFGLKYIV